MLSTRRRGSHDGGGKAVHTTEHRAADCLPGLHTHCSEIEDVFGLGYRARPDRHDGRRGRGHLHRPPRPHTAVHPLLACVRPEGAFQRWTVDTAEVSTRGFLLEGESVSRLLMCPRCAVPSSLACLGAGSGRRHEDCRRSRLSRFLRLLSALRDRARSGARRARTGAKSAHVAFSDPNLP